MKMNRLKLQSGLSLAAAMLCLPVALSAAEPVVKAQPAVKAQSAVSYSDAPITYSNNPIQSISLKNVKPSIFKQELSQMALPEGVDSVIAIDSLNTLLVQGTEEGVDRVREVIALLDKPRTPTSNPYHVSKVDVPTLNEQNKRIIEQNERIISLLQQLVNKGDKQIPAVIKSAR